MTKAESGLPFDDIRNLINNLPEADQNAFELTQAQLNELNRGDLGIMGDICEWFAAWSGRSPSINRPLITLFAGTHKLENEVSDEASETYILEQVTNIASGDAYINRLCQQIDVGLKVFDLALQVPVENIKTDDALDEKGCAGTIAFGMEAIAGGADLLCLAAIEKQPTLSALAVISRLTAGRIDLSNLRSDDAELLANVMANENEKQMEPLEVLRRIGGRETSALCGAILAARSQHIPVILSGVSALASAYVLHALNPSALDHCIYAAQPGNEALAKCVEDLGLKTILENKQFNSELGNLALAAGMAKSATLLLAK
ncbi:MAG: nicotinate-nucleotide--dimethylbenzimidazole phosphoribosyltransferase [Pseudomonadota bacterium]